MIKKILSFGVMVIMALSFSGCVADIDGRYNGLSIGFNYKGGKIDTIMCAVRSDKTEFDVNDVTLDFYFGWYEHPPFGYIGPDSYSSACAAIYFGNEFLWSDTADDYRDVENGCFIREILYEELILEPFSVSMTKKSGKSFSHKESLTIPKELFGAERGLLYFVMIELSFSDSNNTYYARVRGHVKIGYEYINDNTVRLSKPI